MSTVAEIADFIRLTRGLSAATLGKAIRCRWPEANERHVLAALEAVEAGRAVRFDDEVNDVRIVAGKI